MPQRPPAIPLPMRLAVLSMLLFAAGVTGVLAHSNARFYRGDIVASTEWSGVIRLTGTVVIREGATVTVEPGTEILVQPGREIDIVVRGRLFVRGIPSKPVLFGAAGGCAAGPWGGIIFSAGSVGILEHAAVRCSRKGIAGNLAGVSQTGVAVEAGR